MVYHKNKLQGTDMVERIVRQFRHKPMKTWKGKFLKQFDGKQGQRTNMYAWSLKFYNAKWTNKIIMVRQWTRTDIAYCVKTNAKLKVHAIKL